MGKLIAVLIGFLLSFGANAQVYDLVRSITTQSFTVQDTLSNDFTETGTMSIEGNVIKRSSTVCKDGLCTDINLTDELLGLDPEGNSYAVLTGDGGELSILYLLSISPNIMTMKRNEDRSVEIQEYRLRQ